MTATPIIGREDELASIFAFVDAVPDGPSALVLEGEAGIGKSTLWRRSRSRRLGGGRHAARPRVDPRARDALPRLEQAVAEHDAVGDPFGRARALLALGVVRRRGRQKRPAREAIEAARDAFAAMGAAGWAEKANAELARIGGRGPGGDELTPTERRLAELVAEGRSNKEIAAALFVTPKTVGTTLSRLYAKLGVHSRTELVRRLGERPASNV